MGSHPNNVNVRAPNVPFFTPLQDPPAGAALNPQPSGKPIPKVFQPLKIRGVEFQNRIFLSPLCQYSSENGKLQPWHPAHLGGILTRGPGLTFFEATAVTPQGRISPQDAGIWSDDLIEPFANIVQFAHSQNQKIGIQLAHAGRKASTPAPWIAGDALASEAAGGWPNDVWGPSTVPFHESFAHPKELSKDGIKDIVGAFRDAAIRAVKAGFDVVEIHNAHGYLLHEFLSPISNKRSDEYGGSFENRTRLTLEVVDAVRAVIPQDMPLFLRISATDWLEEALPDEPSWRSEDTCKLAPILWEHGVDFLDVSTGGNHPAQKIKPGPAYQAPFSIAVKRTLPPSARDGTATRAGLFVGAVGTITNGHIAEEVLQTGVDAVLVGRQFQKNPATVWSFAEDLGVQIQIASQIRWGFAGRIKKVLGETSEDTNVKTAGLTSKI